MTATGKIVFVHMPKTGGTFVRNMLFRLHGVRHPTSRFSWRRAKWALAGGNMAGDTPYGPLWHRSSTQHAACSQIPPEHSGKLILGCVRNPFDWYVSAYEFGWWRSHPPARWRAAFPELRRQLPRFPDLSFTEFVETDWQSVLATTGRDDIGAYTARFVHYFFRDPGSAIASLGEEYLSSGRYKQDVYDVRFLRMERLSDDLIDFLTDIGYREADLEFIRDHPRVLPQSRQRPVAGHWEQHYSGDLLREARRRERFIVQMFPQYEP